MRCSGHHSAGFLGAPALLLLACIPPQPTPVGLNEPLDLQVVVGGISNTQPFFGRLRTVDGAEGDFLLATCGCGDWRVLITRGDGARAQVAVRFYSDGEYVPSGSVTFYGADEATRTRGTVDQDAGTAVGSIEAFAEVSAISGMRGEAHAQAIQACVMCHVGGDPIWPQPPGHTPYVMSETDCFACHTIRIE